MVVPTSVPQIKATPIAAQDRTEALDALRGAALLGVLLVNLVTDFRVPLLAWITRFHTHDGALNHAADWVVGVGIEMKAYAIFGMLFGVGVAAQADSGRTTGFLIRRFGVLLAIGVIHCVFFFSGDILTLYGLLGFVLIPLRNLHPRTLFVASTLAILVHLSVPPYPVPAHGVNLEAAIRHAHDVYGHGSFGAILRYRLTDLRETILPLAARSAPRTLAMALFGMASWRVGWTRRPERHRALFGVASPILFFVGGAATAIDAYAAATGADLGRGRGVASSLGIVALGLAYASGLLFAATAERGAAILRPIARLGRMTLTSYLAQSAAFGLIFYGYGLGQYGSWGSAPAALLGIGFYAAQVAFANAWLRAHRQGPMEAVWRWLSYGMRGV